MSRVLAVSKLKAREVIHRKVEEDLKPFVTKNVNQFTKETKGKYTVANKFVEDLTQFISNVMQIEIFNIEKAIYNEVIQTSLVQFLKKYQILFDQNMNLP